VVRTTSRDPPARLSNAYEVSSIDTFSVDPGYRHLKCIDLGLIDNLETVPRTREYLMAFCALLAPAYMGFWNPAVRV
jgi:hypothetical protein